MSPTTGLITFGMWPIRFGMRPITGQITLGMWPSTRTITIRIYSPLQGPLRSGYGPLRGPLRSGCGPLRGPLRSGFDSLRGGEGDQEYGRGGSMTLRKCFPRTHAHRQPTELRWAYCLLSLLGHRKTSEYIIAPCTMLHLFHPTVKSANCVHLWYEIF